MPSLRQNPAGTFTAEKQSVILLGASNLTLGWKPAVRALQHVVPGEIDLRVCLGMGRSYIDWSAVLFRRLPGILQCGLWENLPAAGSSSPLVLITDIGNDIAYRREPEDIFQAVDECLRRIRAWRSDARVVMTGLPLPSVEAMGRSRFLVMRTILFPGCLMTFEQACDRSRTLNGMLEHYAQKNQIPFVNPEGAWYRSDPIHVIPPLREKVFRKFFSLWNVDSVASLESQNVSPPALPVTAVRTVAGFSRRASQPVYHSSRLVVSAW
ncbi:MAG: SGNH/GDSL hydrolase family protein [Planctomycetaceae bacterium]